VTKAALTAAGLALLLLCAPVASAAEPTAAFRPEPCPFIGGELAPQYDIDCGYVTVPERRDRPTTRTIELAVAIGHTKNPDTHGSPVVFLNGGPGDSALVGIADLWGTSTLRDNHDLILFDQRGTGYSRPALPCRELERPPDLNFSMADQPASQVRLAMDCLDGFTSDGIDVTAYTTRENAADVEAIRQALGIDRWSLYGISYGTRLALEVLRDHGSTAEAALLDSPYPPQARPFEDASYRFERALGAVLDACDADADCASAYPGVGDRLGEIMSNPERRIDGEFPSMPAWYAATILNGALYSAPDISTVPLLVDAIEKGNASFLRDGYNTAELPIPESSAEGMHHSVECHERAFGIDEAAVAADRSTNIRFGSVEGGLWLKRPVCDAWGADPPTPGELDPVTSDVPTLILVGRFDPVTPPSYAAETLRTLRNGQVVELPGVGHAVTRTPCGLELRDEFLADPIAPIDRSCVAAMPSSIFSTDVASVAGLPYLLDGVFGRSNPTIGQVGIMLLIVIAFATAALGWPVAAAAGAIRARWARSAVPAGVDPVDIGRPDAVSSTGTSRPATTRLAYLARLTALLAIGANAIFIIGMVRVVGAMPDGSLIRAFGLPRPDRWLIRVADVGAVLAVLLSVLVLVVLVRRTDRRRSRAILVFVTSGCVLFSAWLAFYRILGA
jgi:pimeloyl-ACP methyl ester carboxylesterase